MRGFGVFWALGILGVALVGLAAYSAGFAFSGAAADLALWADRGQWLQVAIGVPLTLLGVLVTAGLAWIANQIKQKQGDLDALNFVHSRLAELNSSANVLGAEFEAFYDSLDRTFEVADGQLNEKVKAKTDGEGKNRPHEEIIEECFEEVVSDPLLLTQLEALATQSSAIRSALRSISQSPFSLAVLRKSLQSIDGRKISQELRRIVPRGWIDTDPLAIARQLGESSVGPEVFLDSLRFYYHHSVFVHPIFLFGMVLGYDLYTVGRDKKEKKPRAGTEAVLVNSGLAQLAILNKLLPKGSDVSGILASILHDNPTAVRYAELTAADARIVVNSSINDAIESVWNLPTECILILERNSDGELEWRPYDREKDGKFKNEDLGWSFFTPAEIIEQGAVG
ncbi:MAG: hypothetical protein GC190_15980 [Alphaproteobacteria bacterium]|nr:hypothetical protein [Alphaproteobacteria bacterium]